jgi:hypothetical protein
LKQRRDTRALTGVGCLRMRLTRGQQEWFREACADACDFICADARSDCLYGIHVCKNVDERHQSAPIR